MQRLARIFSASLFTSLAFAALAAPVAYAQTTPHMVRLSFADPDTRTRMAVTWHSDSATPQEVRYGIANVTENSVASTVTAGAVGGGIGYVHSAELQGLTPETTYIYRVGSVADGWAPATGSFTFNTAPVSACAPFTFAALGDIRGLSILGGIDLPSEWPSVFDNVALDDPAFAIIAGDLVYDGDDLDEWHALFTQGTDHYTYLPVMPSFGNHDTGGAGDSHNYEDLYTLPRNDADNERYYWFRYGNALFFAFNSEEDGVANDFAEQGAWLESVLEQEDATWKVIFLHHPVWTTTPGETELTGCSITCGHPPDEQGQNDLLIDLIDRYDIDVVVQSHNHFYERSSPMRGGGSHASKVEVAPAHRGTQVGSRSAGGRVDSWGSLYMVTGGGGATLIPLSLLDGLGQLWAPGQATRNDKYHHVRFDISDLTMTLDVIETSTTGASGTVLDTFTITKLPQYRVDACPVEPGPDGGPQNDGGPQDDGGPNGGDSSAGGGDTLAGGDGAAGAPEDPNAPRRGCGCQGTHSGAAVWLLALAIFGLRRRR